MAFRIKNLKYYSLIYILIIGVNCKPLDTQTNVNNGRCNTINYNQVVSLPGCKDRIIANKYCHGQCVSGYVPEYGQNGLYTCSTCQPVNASIRLVELECEGQNVNTTKVEIFNRCECILNNCYNVTLHTNRKTKNCIAKGMNNIQSIVTPCKRICRHCRKLKRIHAELLQSKTRIQYLQESCRTTECKKRISSKIFQKTRYAKKKMKRRCMQCKSCKKKRRKQRHISPM